MADLSASNFNEQDSLNNSASPNGWNPGVMLPNQVEPTMQATTGALKRFWNRINGIVTTTGTSGAYVYTAANASFPAAYVNGEAFTWTPNFTSLGNDTLNINALGALKIYKLTPKGAQQISAGDLVSGIPCTTMYNTTLNGFILLSAVGNEPNQAYVSAVASAATVDLGAQKGDYIQVTGTTTITALGSSPVAAGPEYTVVFAGALTITNNATSLILPGGANITTAAGDVAKFRYEGSGNWRCSSYARASASPLTVLNGYIFGFTLSNDGTTPNTVLDIAAGTAADSTNTLNITGTAFTKSTAGTWGAGTGNNGMGTGLTIANSTWYHVFAIVNAGATDFYFDTSITAANKPAGTTYFRYVGSFKTDGAAHILAFTQYGQRFIWTSSVLDLNAGTATARTAVTLSVPPGIVTHPIIYLQMSGSNIGNIYPGTTSISQDARILAPSVGSSFEYTQTTSNTSGQVSYNVTGSPDQLSINTTGYINPHVAAVW